LKITTLSLINFYSFDQNKQLLLWQEREKRECTKKLKRELFMQCVLVRVLLGILPFDPIKL
jgi:hypothetical protein